MYPQVRASDWGQPFRRQSELRLTIRIKDINDNRPQVIKARIRVLAAELAVWPSGLSLSQTFNPKIEANTKQANLSRSLFVEANE